MTYIIAVILITKNIYLADTTVASRNLKVSILLWCPIKEAILASSGGSLLSNTLMEPSLQPAANILLSVKKNNLNIQN